MRSNGVIRYLLFLSNIYLLLIEGKKYLVLIASREEYDIKNYMLFIFRLLAKRIFRLFSKSHKLYRKHSWEKYKYEHSWENVYYLEQ